MNIYFYDSPRKKQRKKEGVEKPDFRKEGKGRKKEKFQGVPLNFLTSSHP